jgi:Ca2+-binding RTX toxin-like protein
MFEQLESRRLLSAVIKFSDGTTVTQGGSGSLTIKADNKIGMNTNVIENGISQTNTGVQIGLGNVLIQEFNASTGQFEEVVVRNVKAGKPIKIQGGKGDDTINFDGTSLVADISGDDGNDMITFQDRGAGGTKVDGGNGNDVIAMVFSRNAQINGGAGDDVILLNTAASFETPNDYAHSNVSVQGGGGNDLIITYAGNAKVDGSGGNDTFTDASGGLATYMLKNIQNTQVI